MGQGSNILYYDFVDLQKTIARLCKKVKCLENSTDTNMANTDLVFTGSRTYDGANATIIYNDAGSLDFNTIGATGVQLTNDTGIGDYSALEIASGRIDLTTSAFGSTASHLNLTNTGVVIGDDGGAYFLGDGFATIPPTLDNAQDQVIAIDESNGRLYRRTVASIGGGADTNFAANNLTLTAARTHTGSNLYPLTIGNLTALNLNTGAGNQSIVMDNTGSGVAINSDSSITLFSTDAGLSGNIAAANGFAQLLADSGTEDNGIVAYPGLLGLQLSDSQGNYNFKGTGTSILPLLDDVGGPAEGQSDKMLTVDASGKILRKPIASAGDNFANADLTFSGGDRAHDLNGNELELLNGNAFTVGITNNIQIKVDDGGGNTGEFNAAPSYSYIGGSNGTDTVSVIADSNAGVGLYSSNFKYLINGLVEYADDTAAGVGGLTAGRLYRTATGAVMVKL